MMGITPERNKNRGLAVSLSMKTFLSHSIILFLLALSSVASSQYCTEGTVTYDGHGVGHWKCKSTATINQCQYCESGLLIQNDNSTVQTWKCTNTAGDCGSCFAKETIVFRANGAHILTPVSISGLQIGDVILDGDAKETEFLGYLDADPDSPSVMLEFYEQEIASVPFLSVSPEHLLFVDGLGTQFAGDIKPGQFLINSETGVEVFVAKVIAVKSNGKYAPLTHSGTLAVGPNKIKASCFAHVNSPALSGWYFYAKKFAFGQYFLESASPSWTDQTLLNLLKRVGLGR